MTDLRQTIAPKSDQLNADDLIGATRTIKVTKVSLCGEPDQPIAINFEGDNNKPYKPCKSMRRVMVNVWGPDGNAYAGRSMTLYRDDKVQFGGLAVGGIRISHMSNISEPVTMALTATRANRKPFTVKPLAVVRNGGDQAGTEQPARDPKMVKFVDDTCKLFAACKATDAMFALIDKIKANRDVLRQQAPELDRRIGEAAQAASVRLSPAPPADTEQSTEGGQVAGEAPTDYVPFGDAADDFPGDRAMA